LFSLDFVRAFTQGFLFARFVYGAVALLCFLIVGSVLFRVFAPFPGRDVFSRTDLAYRGVTMGLLALIPALAGFVSARRCLYWHRKTVEGDQPSQRKKI
jgi:hypothetical protein